MNCVNCGAAIKDGAKFCNSCGTKQIATAQQKPDKPSDAEKNGKRGKRFVRLSIICPAVPLIVMELLIIAGLSFWIKTGGYFGNWFNIVGFAVVLMLIAGASLGIVFGIAAMRKRRWWGIAGIILALAAIPNPFAYFPNLLYSSIHKKCPHNPVQALMIENTPRLMALFYDIAEFSRDGKTLLRYNRRVAGIRRVRKYTIPDCVTTIGNEAFWGCPLTSVTIPSSVTTIGDWAFWGCPLTSVTIPSSVTTIGNGAFSACGNLESVIILDGVTTIGKWAFFGSYNLKSVIIPGSVTSIGDGAFRECRNLRSVTIPAGVATIGNEAFWGCSLTSVTIPSSVTTIGERAFQGCSLTSVTIPPSVTTIGSGAFDWCKKVEVSPKNPNLYTDASGALIDRKRKILLHFPRDFSGAYAIPDGVTTIGDGAFSGCKKLRSVMIPPSVTTIGDEAFWGCPLTSVTIPSGVTTIGNKAFSLCHNLTSVTIPSGVTTIGKWAFSGCPLTSVTIPSSVTTIGENAFFGCTNLTSVTIPEGVITIGEAAFRWCPCEVSVKKQFPNYR